MVEKDITSPQNVVDFARYQTVRNAGAKGDGDPGAGCRHCGAVLSARTRRRMLEHLQYRGPAFAARAGPRNLRIDLTRGGAWSARSFAGPGATSRRGLGRAGPPLMWILGAVHV